MDVCTHEHRMSNVPKAGRPTPASNSHANAHFLQIDAVFVELAHDLSFIRVVLNLVCTGRHISAHSRPFLAPLRQQ